MLIAVRWRAVALICVIAVWKAACVDCERDGNASGCLTFLRYVPSQWEDQWLYDTNRHNDICGAMQQDAHKAQAWLDVTQQRQHVKVHQRSLSQDVGLDGIWPKYVYRDTCAGKHKDIQVHIEPAVGLLRSPRTEACSTDESRVVAMDSRDYIMLAPQLYTRYFPGRKLLFDIGSGKVFNSSLQWLVESYEHQGLTFDEIWCWEAQTLDAHDFWHSVPYKWSPAIHFYNTYATVEVNGSSPVHALQQMYKPGDFVTVKLDIDNEELEIAILNQLLEHAHMVNEVFFEMHFNAPEMHPWFGQLDTSFNETLTLFRQFRGAGMRLHYWP